MDEMERSNRRYGRIKLLVILGLLGVMGYILYRSANLIELEILPEQASLLYALL